MSHLPPMTQGDATAPQGPVLPVQNSAFLQVRQQAPAHRPDQLIIHADRGRSMTSQPVALLLATLGVVPSHSRPHVSNDNPFSEAQFKTPSSMRILFVTPYLPSPLASAHSAASTA